LEGGENNMADKMKAAVKNRIGEISMEKRDY